MELEFLDQATLIQDISLSTEDCAPADTRPTDMPMDKKGSMAGPGGTKRFWCQPGLRRAAPDI
jgi:hypothetical protein